MKNRGLFYQVLCFLTVSILLLMNVKSTMAEQVDNSFGDLSLGTAKKMLFSVPFNGSIEVSEYAKLPNPVSSIKEYCTGKNGNNAARIGNGCSVQYNADGNISFKSGAITFNLKPEKHPDNMRAAENAVVKIIDSNGNVFIKSPENNLDNSWEHIALIWEKGKYNIYVNGEKTSAGCLPDNAGSPGKIIIGELKYKGLIQDFRIYDQPLSGNEIKEIMLGNEIAFCGEDAERTMPVLSACPAAKAPVIDGKLSDECWENTVSFIGFVDNTNRKYADRQTRVSVSYDKQNLYVSMKSDIIEKSLSENDYYTLIIRPQGENSPKIFVMRPDGKLTDETGKAASKDVITSTSKIENGNWIWEVAIKYAGLGVKPPGINEQWNINFCRNFSSPIAETSWVAKRMTGLDKINSNETGKLIFNPETPVIRIETFGALQLKDYNLLCNFIIKEKGEGLYVFIDTIKNRKMERGAFTESADAGQLRSLSVKPGPPGTSHIRGSEYISYSFVNKTFRKVYFRTDKFPSGIPPQIEIKEMSFEKRKNLKINVGTYGLIPALIKTNMTIKISIYDKEVEICSGQTSDLSKENINIILPLDRLKPGVSYTVKAILKKDRDIVAESSSTILYPDVSSWLGNKLGMDNIVPSPWPPIETDGNSAACWGRKYTFSTGSGFPSEITSKGESLLAAPIRLIAKTDKGAAEWEEKKGGFISAEKTNAVYRACESSGNLKVEYGTKIEYDGMMKIDFTIIPDGSVTIENMKLEIPIKKKFAKYLGYTESVGAGQHSYHFYGATPDGKTEIRFLPFVWLGDEDRGLLWFCESARGWRPESPNKSIIISNNNDNVTLIANIIEKATVLKERITFTIGLQASPVKPLPENWRETESKLVYMPTTMTHFAYLPETMKSSIPLLEKYKKAGKTILGYSFLNNVSTNLPEYNLFFDEWKREKNSPKGKYYVDVVAPDVKSWQDFVVWSYVKALKDFDFDGVYYDLSWPSPTTSPDHGGYVDENGKPARHWPIFAVREIAKRAYVAFRESKKQTAFMGHCSSNPIVLPVLSFCDYSLEGEQFGHVLHSYMEQIPLDKARAEFSGRQFGMIPVFLPEIAKSGNKNYNEKTPEPTEEMLAVLYLHDIMFYPIFIHAGALKKYNNVKMQFIGDGMGIEFIPYWNDGGTFKSNDKNVKISAYRKNGEILMIISNFNKDELDAEIEVKLSNHGISGEKTSFTDCISKKDITFENSKIKTKIKGRSLNMILIHK